MEANSERYVMETTIMTDKEQILAIYPDARMETFRRIARDTTPDEICHSLIIGSVYHGNPIEETIGTGSSEENMWADGWENIQKEMLRKLKL